MRGVPATNPWLGQSVENSAADQRLAANCLSLGGTRPHLKLCCDQTVLLIGRAAAIQVEFADDVGESAQLHDVLLLRQRVFWRRGVADLIF